MKVYGFTQQEYDRLKNKSIVVKVADEKGIRLKTKRLHVPAF